MGRTYDCIVIGGGPAACTSATLAAAAECETLLLLPEPGWRWSSGEEVPREARGILRRLGLPDDAGQRSDWGGLLLQNAVSKGVEIRPASRVREVVCQSSRHAPRAVGGRGAAPVAVAGRSDGEAETVAGRVIVEATRSVSRDHAALWAYYRGARPKPGIAEGELVVPTRQGKSWFWFVPLPDGVTSVGVVFPAEGLAGRESPESLLEEELCDCPTVLERLIDAELASEFHVLSEAPWPAPRVAGDGRLLLEDCAPFADAPGTAKVPGGHGPAPSCALFLALKAGEMTADCIGRTLATGN